MSRLATSCLQGRCNACPPHQRMFDSSLTESPEMKMFLDKEKRLHREEADERARQAASSVAKEAKAEAKLRRRENCQR